jgi:hypothetical protein
MKITIGLSAILLILLYGCNPVQQKQGDVAKQPPAMSVDSTQLDSLVSKDSLRQPANVVNDSLATKLKLIRDNFKRINSIAKWTSVINKELNESTEGGEAVFYYVNGVLEKIVTRHFGETYQQLAEYYLLDKQLSFVFEKEYKYNRPFTYDSAAMKANNDDQYFDINKSQVTTSRSYFEKGKLIQQLRDPAEVLQGEQERLLTGFNSLMALK